jgi:hypothetical protein
MSFIAHLSYFKHKYKHILKKQKAIYITKSESSIYVRKKYGRGFYKEIASADMYFAKNKNYITLLWAK